MTIRLVCILLLSLTIGTAVAQNTAQGGSKATCAVVGFVNVIENAEWGDARVGMGVRALLAQSLFETGLFALIEEKSEIAVKLDEAAKAAWLDKKNGALDNATLLAGQSGASVIASGKIFHYGQPRTRASVGPAHFASDEVEIKIEVTLTNVSDGKKITAVGSGKAKTVASSALFTYHGENLDAEKSMVGTATRKAIDAAVEEIAGRYRKTYRVR